MACPHLTDVKRNRECIEIHSTPLGLIVAFQENGKF